jgi:hypothetical protein
MASSLSGGPRNSGRVWVQFIPLTREGDVQGDTHPDDKAMGRSPEAPDPTRRCCR